MGGNIAGVYRACSGYFIHTVFLDETIMKALTLEDYKMAADVLKVSTSMIQAIAEVESAGTGFLHDGGEYDGCPKILFEGHKFYEFTKGAYAMDHPTICYPEWTSKYYLGGSAEYKRLNLAKGLNLDAALKATSWGKFQIMGFNYAKCGYDDVKNYVHFMEISEKYHLRAFINLIKAMGWDVYLQMKDFAEFALHYNGRGYKKNNYDVKLEKAYNKFEGLKNELA